MEANKHPRIQAFGKTYGDWYSSVAATLQDLPTPELKAIVRSATTYTHTNCWFAEYHAAQQMGGEAERILQVRANHD